MEREQERKGSREVSGLLRALSKQPRGRRALQRKNGRMRSAWRREAPASTRSARAGRPAPSKGRAPPQLSIVRRGVGGTVGRRGQESCQVRAWIEQEGRSWAETATRRDLDLPSTLEIPARLGGLGIQGWKAKVSRENPAQHRRATPAPLVRVSEGAYTPRQEWGG